MIDELRAKLQDALDEHRRLKAVWNTLFNLLNLSLSNYSSLISIKSKDEDDAVLQAGLDQTLLALANLQKVS